MKISVFGLGYVGAVTAGCLTQQGHQVVGVDVSAQKVETLNRGEAAIIEPGLEDLLKQAHQQVFEVRVKADPERFARELAAVGCSAEPREDFLVVRVPGWKIESVGRLHGAHHRLVLRLWTWTCSPLAISATALPMSWPYFHTVSPDLMSTSAIL